MQEHCGAPLTQHGEPQAEHASSRHSAPGTQTAGGGGPGGGGSGVGGGGGGAGAVGVTELEAADASDCTP